jgi:hypothetical protein
MPMDLSRYPQDWKAIAFQLKEDAEWKCRQCGKPCRKRGESVTDFEKRLSSKWKPLLSEKLEDHERTGVVQYKPKRFLLTVAHLDQDPSNISSSNLKVLCAPCHLRFDVKFRDYNRRRLLERQGQLSLFPEPGDSQR